VCASLLFRDVGTDISFLCAHRSLFFSVYFEGPSFHDSVDFAQYFADVNDRSVVPRSLRVSFAAAWFLRKLYGDAGPKFEKLMVSFIHILIAVGDNNATIFAAGQDDEGSEEGSGGGQL
jgi:hypothetical protein